MSEQRRSRRPQDDASLAAFFAEADDILDNWQPEPDASTWAADGSHQPERIGGEYYRQDQVRERDQGLDQGLEPLASILAMLAESYLATRDDQRRIWSLGRGSVELVEVTDEQVFEMLGRRRVEAGSPDVAAVCRWLNARASLTPEAEV